MNLFKLIHNAMKSKMNVHTKCVCEIKVEYKILLLFFYREVYNAIVRVNRHRIGNSHDACCIINLEYLKLFIT